jgi:PAS domain S-box-containing protein
MKFNSIETRLVFVLLFLTVLPVIAVGWLAHDLVFEDIRSERMKTVGRVAKAKHDQLAMALAGANGRAGLFLADLGTQCAGVATLDRRCATGRLESWLFSEKALGATLRRGSMRLNAGTPLPADGRPLRPGQLAGFSGTGSGNNQSFVTVTASGLQLDIVYPSSNLQPIFDRPDELGESGETFLADGAGYFVTRNRYPATQGHGEHIHAAPMQSCLRGENNEVLDLDYRDAEIIHGYRHIPELGSACIMAHIDQAEAFAPLLALQQKLAGTAAVVIVLALLVAFVMARSIARPVAGLTKVARSIALGDYRARAEVSGSDEIAELAGSFNSMTGQLEQKILEIEKSEERYRKLFEETSDALAFADAQTGEIIELNQSFADMLGWERTELIGKPQRILHPPEPEAMVSSIFRQHRSEQAGKVIETVALTRQGQMIEVAIKAAVMDLNGRKVVLASFRDVTARKLAERKLAESYRKLQELALHLERVREEERLRIALELHDEMGSTLAALSMSVRWLASKPDAGRAQLAEELEQMDKLVADAIRTMRHVVSQLRPVQLRDFGFTAAVERYVREFGKRTGIECALALPEEIVLDDGHYDALFRILQEALNNVARHAGAKRVGVTLASRKRSLLLLVGDDGIGFDTNVRKTDSFGLLGIRERAMMIGGWARIDSAPGRGTRVAVRIAVTPPG